MPSYSTIRRILIGVDFDILAKIFNQWAQNYVHVETSEWFGIDGKSIKGTVQDYKNEYQNFVSIVSVFTDKRGLVLSLSKLENKQGSEISTVQNLIALLDIEGVVFSKEALHCQKKRGLLIIDSGNDYAIAVKANQKNLYHQIRHNTENSQPTSRYITAEKTRNRATTRTIEVFHDLTGISPEWAGLESLIKVERIGTRASMSISPSCLLH